MLLVLRDKMGAEMASALHGRYASAPKKEQK